MTAPFPYYGGKGRWCDVVWEQLGDPGVYVEPFLGTGAMLLGKDKPAAREVVCEINGYICNLFRAVREDYALAAYHADYPTVHQDLVARHRWLVEWGDANAERLSADPDFYDCRAAGWWAWGASNWIGHGWCDVAANWDSRPYISGGSTGGGRGASAQRRDMPIPAVSAKTGGRGVQAQRDKMPTMGGVRPGGRGVQAQRRELAGAIVDGTRLAPWFRALAERLARVVVLNRSWEAAVSDTVLQQAPTSSSTEVAVFMDPPYRTVGRAVGLYRGDAEGVSDDVAAEAYRWAVEHGREFRIAYACERDDFPVPDGWRVGTRSFA